MNKIVTRVVLGLAGLFPCKVKPQSGGVPYVKDGDTGVTILEPANGPYDPSFISRDRNTGEATLNVVAPETGRIIEKLPYRRFIAPKIS